jgi:tetratricopeptide (TPR) repeat protein
MEANICLAKGVEKGKHTPSCEDKLICETYQLLEGRGLSEYDKLRHVGITLAGRGGDALKYLDRAIALEPNNPQAYLNKAVVYIIKKRHEEALECQNKATELDPKKSEYWSDKGLTLAVLGRYGEAICCFDNAFNLDPTNLSSSSYAEGLRKRWR